MVDQVTAPVPGYNRRRYRARSYANGPFLPWGNWEERPHVAGTVKIVPSITRSFAPNPEWSSRLARGEVTIGPYTCSGKSVSYGYATGHTLGNPGSYGQYEYEVNNWPCGGITSNGFNPATPTTLDYDLESQLMIEMMSKVKGGAMQALVSLAEAPKTWDLIFGAARNAANVLIRARNALHGDARALRQLKDLVKKKGSVDAGLQAWLEWRYGWRQVLFDIENATDAVNSLQNHLEGQLRRERARGNYEEVSSETMTSKTDNSLQLATGFGIIYEKRVTTVSPIVLRGEAIGFYTVNFMGEYHKQLGLSIAPTVWELIPFSFVADWFVNIGQWLRAYATLVPGMTMEGAQFGILRASEIKIATTSVGFTNAVPYLFAAPEPTIVKKFSFSRAPKAADSVYLPSLHNGLNLLRAIDAIALLRALTKSVQYDVHKLRV